MARFFFVNLLMFLYLLLSKPTFALTYTDLSVKLGQVINLQQQNSLYAQPGYDVDGDGSVDTLASLDTKYTSLSLEERAEWRARLFCQPKPINSTDFEAWASWRMCISASHLILALYHTWEYREHGQNPKDLARAATHYYLETVHVDTLVTGSEYSTLSNVSVGADPQVTYKLRDATWVDRYLPDSGSGYINVGVGIYTCDSAALLLYQSRAAL